MIIKIYLRISGCPSVVPFIRYLEQNDVCLNSLKKLCSKILILLQIFWFFSCRVTSSSTWEDLLLASSFSLIMSWTADHICPIFSVSYIVLENVPTVLTFNNVMTVTSKPQSLKIILYLMLWSLKHSNYQTFTRKRSCCNDYLIIFVTTTGFG